MPGGFISKVLARDFRQGGSKMSRRNFLLRTQECESKQEKNGKDPDQRADLLDLSRENFDEGVGE